MAQEKNKPAHARLPRFDVLKYAYLNGPPSVVKLTIGGHLNTPEFPDTCAMRMSWTLNHANIPIPAPHHSNILVLSGDPIGGQPQWYAIRHAEIREWLTHIAGSPQLSRKSKPISIQEFSQFHEKTARGIIILDVAYIQHPGQADATGHIDLWDGDTSLRIRSTARKKLRSPPHHVPISGSHRSRTCTGQDVLLDGTPPRLHVGTPGVMEISPKLNRWLRS